MFAFMTPFTAILFVAAACVVRLVEAVPLTASETRRDVADPPVTAPNASTVWVVGETQTVVWDISNLPDQITNTNGTVLLGFVNDTTSGEHLMTDSPLASGFDIRNGSVDIVVPDVESRTDYIIALLGDSGNISDKFTIKSSSSSATSSAGPSATSSSVVFESESGMSSESISSSSASAASEISTSPAMSTLTTSASSGTLAALSSQSSASGTALASQSSASTSTSAARTQTSFSRLVQFTILILCIFILA